MKRIHDLRILERGKEYDTLLCSSTTYVDTDKVGYYDHNGEIYRYAGSNAGTDYFIIAEKDLPKGFGKDFEKG